MRPGAGQTPNGVYVDGPLSFVVTPAPEARIICLLLKRHWRDFDDLDGWPEVRARMETQLEAFSYVGDRYIAEVRARAATLGKDSPPPSAVGGKSRGEEPELTTAEVAERLHMSERSVRDLASTGKLPAKRDRSGWLFNAAAVETYKGGGW